MIVLRASYDIIPHSCFFPGARIIIGRYLMKKALVELIKLIIQMFIGLIIFAPFV